MTKSDIGVIAGIYAICLLFFYMTLQLKAAAQIYPLCLICGLALLNTLYLARCVLRQLKSGKGALLLNDLPEIFQGFLPAQFFFVLGACVLYLVLLKYLGFYLCSLLYLVGVMLWFRVRLSYLALTVALLGALVYAVFTLFLKVPLPEGALFALA